MKDFFGKDLLLSTPAAKELYEGVKDLPILDYHCHLDEWKIKENAPLGSLGELWLAGDHYKWRAMRLCGVDEKYITGDASFEEKYMAFARIFPKLCGSPLYYWTQMELSLIFDIHEPLCEESAMRIYNAANEKLKTMRTQDLLARFGVRYVATTDDPVSPLSAHGMHGGTQVSPTFRPDRFVSLDEAALTELENVMGHRIATLSDLEEALSARLTYFYDHGCRIADHGIDFLPGGRISEADAAALFAKRDRLDKEERASLSDYLIYFMAEKYAEKGIVMQLHFAAYRNVNSVIFPSVGKDAGFDIMHDQVDTDALVRFLDTLHKRGKLPRCVLYTLNPVCVPALCTLSGAFPGVLVGAAWWFNDTVGGIREQLKNISEYAVLGTNLGMLTDSRSFASYGRFDFFRRILADFVGGYVERGEYDLAAARQLMQDVCYENTRALLGL